MPRGPAVVPRCSPEPPKHRSSWARSTRSWKNSLVAQVEHAALADADPGTRLNDRRLERGEGPFFPCCDEHGTVRRTEVADLYPAADQRDAQVQPGDGAIRVGDPYGSRSPG